MPTDADTAWVIHAGTAHTDDRLVTAGGRVLGSVGVGEDFTAARAEAYGLLDGIAFAGMQFRGDIGAGFKE